MGALVLIAMAFDKALWESLATGDQIVKEAGTTTPVKEAQTRPAAYRHSLRLLQPFLNLWQDFFTCFS
ncbi:hypothetical protein ACFYZB_42700 [Streptomyces sp. NPDC001852]|uniref:DUF7489 domain-containing protein n=1 Tax=Streptomyces sp. NPDC001852 TaxID=3364619 RepID=UPI0036747B60